MEQGVRAGETAAEPGWTSNRGNGLGFEISGQEMNITALGLALTPELR